MYECLYTGVIEYQEQLWRETTECDEADILRGGEHLTKVDPKLFHDIQVIIARLVAKASQLIDNVTTNIAES